MGLGSQGIWTPELAEIMFEEIKNQALSQHDVSKSYFINNYIFIKMKTQIKKVQDYFKNKMLSSDFEIINVEEHLMELLIDSEYKFIIWTGNIDIPESRKPYNGKLSFMDIGMTDEEAAKFDELLLPAINKFRKENLLAQKMEELERLQNELSSMS